MNRATRGAAVVGRYRADMSEWVGTVVAGIVGVVGIASTYWTAKRGRDAQLRLSREDRDQGRKETLYVDLWVAMRAMLDEADATLPKFRSNTAQTIGPGIDESEVGRLNARAALLSSAEIDEIVTKFSTGFRSLRSNAAFHSLMIASVENGDTTVMTGEWGMTPAQVSDKVHDNREYMHTAFEDFEDQAAIELGGSPRKRPWRQVPAGPGA